MFTFLFTATGVACAVLAVLLLRAKAPIPAVVGFALTYDNAVIAAGSAIGEGDLLLALNAGRFWVHALVTPLMIWAGLAIVNWVRPIAFIVIGILIAVGVYIDIVTLELVPQTEHGVLRYVNDAAAGPPIPAIVTILILIACGVVLFRRTRIVWLLLGAVVMFVAAGAGVLWLGNFGEAVLLTGFLLTARRLDCLGRQEEIVRT